ncbi:hypothetical protein HYW43_03305, partial [Candidatus Daviesbacteria bacterium]|nr:hypothetical protein [Candidatus Daviesbacteria bacterium]
MDKLRKPQDSKSPILSVYLGTEEKRVPYPTYFLSQLHSLVNKSLTEDEQKIWQKYINKIEDYLHESFDRSNNRSLVFFAGDNLWEVLDFEFFLSPLVIISNSLYLKPIEEGLKDHQRYLVLLVDRKKAKFFTVYLGEIAEQKEVFNGDVPQRVKAKTINWGRYDKIPRHIEDHLNKHLKQISQAVYDFAIDKNIHFIILGGNKEIILKIRKHLHYPLNKMVLGEFVTQLNIPLNEVLIHSKKIATKIKQRLVRAKRETSQMIR